MTRHTLHPTHYPLFDRISALVRTPPPFRYWAIGAGGVLTLTYLSILYSVIVIVGNIPPWMYLAEITIVLVLAWVLSRTISIQDAMLIAGVFLVGGFIGYLMGVPMGLLDFNVMVRDFLTMISGVSILRMMNAGRWVVGFTPAPVFFTWYCFFRSRYTLGGIIGGVTLMFFFFTGDLDVVLGLLGVLSMIGVFGFGRLQTSGGTSHQRDTLLTIGVVILVVATSISLVPGGTAQPLVTSDDPTTIEDSIFGLNDRVQITGSVSTSPTVQFTVNSSEPAYWRADAYDRYTGDGWVLTGQPVPYTEELSGPDTDRVRTIDQRITVEQASNTMPVAWQPVRVAEAPTDVLVTDADGLQPADQLAPGQEYQVTSRAIESPPGVLQEAGTDYPSGIQQRYTQLPDSTPRALGDYTRNLTANAENPYETALVIEQWLIDEKSYTLNAPPPSGDIASQFLFEMDAGYCLYFATTMVAMLRSQDIPARMAVGYTTGQPVGEDTYVVRALNSHAWVEVYFPNHGWVSFDPTPSAPRNELRTQLVNEARESGEENVDTNQSTGVPPGFSDDDDSSEETPTDSGNESPSEIGENLPSDMDEELIGQEGLYEPQSMPEDDQPTTSEPTNTTTDTEQSAPEIPDRGTLVYSLILSLGGVIVIYRTGFTRMVSNELWVRRDPQGTAHQRVAGVYNRVEYLLRKRHRPRSGQETRRAYIDSLQDDGIEPEVNEIYELYEQSRYAGRTTDADAERALEVYNRLREKWHPGLVPELFQ